MENYFPTWMVANQQLVNNFKMHLLLSPIAVRKAGTHIFNVKSLEEYTAALITLINIQLRNIKKL